MPHFNVAFFICLFHYECDVYFFSFSNAEISLSRYHSDFFKSCISLSISEFVSEESLCFSPHLKMYLNAFPQSNPSNGEKCFLFKQSSITSMHSYFPSA